MGNRYEIRPGSPRPGQSRHATHSEVLLALKATAKELGLVAKLPAGNRAGNWRASIDGLTVAGDTKRFDDRTLETFHVEGPCAQDTLLVFAAHIAAIAGTQAVIGETDAEFWFVDAPPKSKGKPKGSAKPKPVAKAKPRGKRIVVR